MSSTQLHALNSPLVSCLEQILILSKILLTYKTLGCIVAGTDARSYFCKLVFVFI